MTINDRDTIKAVYKIRRRSDGLYSKGGSTPQFSKAGKTWANKQALHGHLALLQEYDGYRKTNTLKTVYDDCEVVQYAVVVGSAMLVKDYEDLRRKS